MARVYVSSTYKDLADVRQQVAKALRMFGHQVIAMEDYVAQDARPLGVCLRDVASCHIYVGIVAFRYGFIPADQPAGNNPDGLSITELEMAHAATLGIPRLIFVLKEGAAWPTDMLDSQAPDGGGGLKVAALRARLLKESLISTFASGPELVNLVSAAVTKTVGGTAPMETLPHVRQIRNHVLLLHAAPDLALAQAWADALSSRGLNASLDARGLLAQTAQEVMALEAALVSHQTVVLLVTVASAGLMASHGAVVTRALCMASNRTGCLIALLNGVTTLPDVVPAVTCVTTAGVTANGIDPIELAQLLETLDERSTLRERLVIGLPYTIVAMTAQEAADLEATPKRASEDLPQKYQAQFDDMRQALVTVPAAGGERHGASRADWRPLGGKKSARAMLNEIVDRLNAGGRSSDLGERKIQLQYYPIDPLLDPPDAALRPVYATLERIGCVALVDELSLFHWSLRVPVRAFLGEPQVSVITVAPTASARSQIEDLLEAEARKQLGSPYKRYVEDFDPQYEFGVAEERQLQRYLHRSLPDVMQRIREPGIDRGKRQALRDELKMPTRNMGDILWPVRDSR